MPSLTAAGIEVLDELDRGGRDGYSWSHLFDWARGENPIRRVWVRVGYGEPGKAETTVSIKVNSRAEVFRRAPCGLQSVRSRAPHSCRRANLGRKGRSWSRFTVLDLLRWSCRRRSRSLRRTFLTGARSRPVGRCRGRREVRSRAMPRGAPADATGRTNSTPCRCNARATAYCAPVEYLVAVEIASQQVPTMVRTVNRREFLGATLGAP